jgi:uncharacterized membrane protein
MGEAVPFTKNWKSAGPDTLVPSRVSIGGWKALTSPTLKTVPFFFHLKTEEFCSRTKQKTTWCQLQHQPPP